MKREPLWARVLAPWIANPLRYAFERKATSAWARGAVGLLGMPLAVGYGLWMLGLFTLAGDDLDQPSWLLPLVGWALALAVPAFLAATAGGGPPRTVLVSRWTALWGVPAVLALAAAHFQQPLASYRGDGLFGLVLLVALYLPVAFVLGSVTARLVPLRAERVLRGASNGAAAVVFLATLASLTTLRHPTLLAYQQALPARWTTTLTSRAETREEPRAVRRQVLGPVTVRIEGTTLALARTGPGAGECRGWFREGLVTVALDEDNRVAALRGEGRTTLCVEDHGGWRQARYADLAGRVRVPWTYALAALMALGAGIVLRQRARGLGAELGDPKRWLQAELSSGWLRFPGRAGQRRAGPGVEAFEGPVVVIPLGAEANASYRDDGAPPDGYVVPGSLEALRDAHQTCAVGAEVLFLAFALLGAAPLLVAIVHGALWG
ncbi:MAG: hypothetical protein HY909_20995 [Deltaproteobacteria bacterium]|nr:hypothetical protein [Deltaproteobacteria bacterium]